MEITLLQDAPSLHINMLLEAVGWGGVEHDGHSTSSRKRAATKLLLPQHKRLWKDFIILFSCIMSERWQRRNGAVRC